MVGGTGLYLRRRWRTSTCARRRPRRARALGGRAGDSRRLLLSTRCSPTAPGAAEIIDPNDRRRIVRALELLDAGALEPPDGESRLWTQDTRHPTLLAGLTMEREALTGAWRRGWTRCSPPGRARRCCARIAAGASVTACQAVGFDELVTGDIEAMKRRTRNLARRQLT